MIHLSNLKSEAAFMIKVLIVDDDQLVRKGLMFAMPWSDFDMKVVGEANNGKKALEFLENETVNLIITDLNMPVMSGIEFMRTARKLYPKISIAVLTLHQDFESIQEALRLGAIDFITKVELESEKFNLVLERIYSRINKEQKEDAHPTNNAYFKTDAGFALLFEKEQQSGSCMQHIQDSHKLQIQQIDQSLWFCIPNHGTALEEIREELSQKVDGSMLEVNGIKDRFCNHVYRLLLNYRDRLYFYEYTNHKGILIKSIEDIEKESRHEQKNKGTVKKNLFSYKWVYEDEQLADVLAEMERLQLSSEEWNNLILEMMDKWKEKYPFIKIDFIEPIAFSKWNDVKSLLKNFRDVVKVTAGNRYAVEVVNSILRGLRLIQDKLNENLTADEIAKSVNMSKSYFHKCFKDIVGKSFNQYVRESRIEKAKLIIEQSNEPIQIIAEKIGYLDEKYFSKVFREQTGFLPSEYRKRHRKG
jgi:two-component system response regulator YesN